MKRSYSSLRTRQWIGKPKSIGTPAFVWPLDSTTFCVKRFACSYPRDHREPQFSSIALQKPPHVSEGDEAINLSVAREKEESLPSKALDINVNYSAANTTGSNSPGDEFFGDSPKGLAELWAASIYTYLVKHVASSRFIKRVKDDEKLGHFARDCVSILDRPTLKKELGDQILVKMKHILNENKDMITDKQSEAHLHLAALVLATHRTVCHLPFLLGDPQIATDIVTHCFTQHMRAATIYVMRRALAQRYLGDSLQRGARILGNSFRIEFESKEEEYLLTMKVKKCFFNTFFRRNNAASLTKIFCAWDGLWKEAADPKAYNVAFFRPELLSEGNDMCKFEYRRVQKSEEPLWKKLLAYKPAMV